jgi:hypothetical protein
VDVDELIKAYRANRAAARQRVGETQMNYANAGIAAMIANRVRSAQVRSLDEATALKRDILALPHGEDLISALDREDRARKLMRHERAFGGDRWERTGPAFRISCTKAAREVKTIAAKVKAAQA